MRIVYQVIVGLIVSGAISWLAYRRNALSGSGVIGAMLTGTCIFGLGGWVWGTLLITFFVLSTLLSKYRQQAKRAVAEKFSKGSRRDIWQALANGGAGSLLALAYALSPRPLLFFAFAGAMAAVNADTWATELGVLSRHAPRMITTGKPVERGTSGGVSLLGFAATLAGSTAIGLVAVIAMAIDAAAGGLGFGLLGELTAPALVAVAAAGGLCGSVIDSLLGATVQAIYFSKARNKETEKRVEADGTPNLRIRGWTWLDNDWVNFLSSLAGAAASALLGLILAG